MELVWVHGEATVRSTAERLADGGQPAYTTVMTVMSRLVEKGLLSRRLEGRAYVYCPTKTKGEFFAETSRAMVHSLVRDFGEVALAHFVQEIEQADPEKLRRLSELLRRRVQRR